MKRRLLNLVTALSLLLCVAVGVLWIRSYWAAEWVWYNRFTTGRDATTLREIVFCVGEGQAASAVSTTGVPRLEDLSRARAVGWVWETYEADSVSDKVPGRFGFGIDMTGRLPRPFGYWSCTVALPLWFVTLAFALLPLTRLSQLLRRPLLPGLCRKCGYDLRATPGRCPQCGTASGVTIAG